MKFLKSYNESKLEDFKSNLKYFKNVLKIETSMSELLDSIKAIKMDLESLFPSIKKKEVLSKLIENSDLIDSLKEKKLKLSEFFDSDTFDTFSKFPIRWYWIYNEDSSDLDNPIYILFRYYRNGEWSENRLYYISDDITKFLDTLTLVTIEFRVDGKRWFYTTSDSGRTWLLDTNEKNLNDEIVKSNERTITFRETLNEIDILKLAKNKKTKLFVY